MISAQREVERCGQGQRKVEVSRPRIPGFVVYSRAGDDFLNGRRSRVINLGWLEVVTLIGAASAGFLENETAPPSFYSPSLTCQATPSRIRIFPFPAELSGVLRYMQALTNAPASTIHHDETNCQFEGRARKGRFLVFLSSPVAARLAKTTVSH